MQYYICKTILNCSCEILVYILLFNIKEHFNKTLIKKKISNIDINKNVFTKQNIGIIRLYIYD